MIPTFTLETPDRGRDDLADWLEAWFLTEEAADIGDGEVLAELRDVGVLEDYLGTVDGRADDGSIPGATEIGEDATEEAGDLEENTARAAALELLYAEVDARLARAQCVYPFETTTSGVCRRDEPPAHARHYEFLRYLAISGTRFREEKRWVDVDGAFDEIAKLALGVFVGGRAIGFARPSLAEEATADRPVSFPKAIKGLADELGLETGSLIPRRRSSDAGVDVVAWRRFADSMGGHVVVLAQCTVRRDWHLKGGDLKMDKWRGYIQFNKDPSFALVIPHAVSPANERLPEILRDVHIVIDRLRLCELLCDASDDLGDGLRDMQPWLLCDRCVTEVVLKVSPAAPAFRQARLSHWAAKAASSAEANEMHQALESGAKRYYEVTMIVRLPERSPIRRTSSKVVLETTGSTNVIKQLRSEDNVAKLSERMATAVSNELDGVEGPILGPELARRWPVNFIADEAAEQELSGVLTRELRKRIARNRGA